MSDNPEDHLLALTLDAAVPFRVLDYVQKGGPDEDDLARTREVADVLGAEADVLQYGGSPSSQTPSRRQGKGGHAARLFTLLTDALAVMSFVPGGVRFCGRRWLASAGWPYLVLDSEVKEPPGVVLQMSHGRRIVARYRRAEA